MKTEKQKMLDGEAYLANDPELIKGRTDAKKLLHRLNVTEYLFNDVAKEIVKELIPNAGEGLYIEPSFHADYGYNIHCGTNVYFNVNCVVLDVCKVTIGSNVFFAPAVQVYTATHPLDATERRSTEFGKPITIGDDCWIGGGTIICPGVTIGSRCVIGAGSVVTKDIPDDSLAVGNPAKVIRKL
ncbi:sugar O-acetyltransferase [Mucilaginibacter polytrichastri]|uniref:Putative acetyltransferase n=1 Tax=Mucilaginibacter polytrichastri TaxID=1302689 RepID=A0A1Q5ZZP2_9SPHI|nr:sugar O-acetyltransferase [Mucilaginibacter polytrichastri]OKS87212.1 Putative acetyltransferase [Mucilaginibacter polytrichastri]SFT19085.1 maltose O-acetyltransferase [Mucilaginibacter polytrichastri]